MKSDLTTQQLSRQSDDKDITQFIKKTCAGTIIELITYSGHNSRTKTRENYQAHH